VQNLLSLWSAMDARRRVVVVGATIAMFLSILAMSRMASTPSLSLLYAGLDSATAGDVVAALEQQGVAYEIRGDAIHVEQSRRDSLRMTLAAEGLPANSGAGYELLDGLSGFGTTSQMFDAAYWRAKEGELARTILSNAQIRAARVHIAQAPSQPFQREAVPTASVTVTTSAGGLSPAQADALRHLVAAAVAGMKPGDVAVIDTVAGLIAAGADASMPATTGDARAAELRRNVERLLAARVGPGKAVVEVAVDVETEREAVTERRFDPQGRVAISSDTESRKGSDEQGGGDVTVASNLPDGQAAAGGGGTSQNEETRERVNYEVSETQREILRVPGALRKISVAVLVDGVNVTAADGSVTLQPRPEEELTVLRELVASAVGLDEARGDVLTLRSLAFEPLAAQGTMVEAGLLGGLSVDPMSALQLAVLALVALILGVFVLRPILLATPRAALGLPAPSAPLALAGSLGSRDLPNEQRVLTGEIDDGGDLPDLSLISDFDGDGAPADPASRLRRLIEERQAESVEILRGWMEQQEERV